MVDMTLKNYRFRLPVVDGLIDYWTELFRFQTFAQIFFHSIVYPHCIEIDVKLHDESYQTLVGSLDSTRNLWAKKYGRHLESQNDFHSKEVSDEEFRLRI